MVVTYSVSDFQNGTPQNRINSTECEDPSNEINNDSTGANQSRIKNDKNFSSLLGLKSFAEPHLLPPLHKKSSTTTITAEDGMKESQKYQDQQTEDEDRQSCEACLYTGIATCTGLSLYFAKIALLETPDVTQEMSREVAKGHRRNRLGFLVVSAFWFVTGVYRWHLG